MAADERFVHDADRHAVACIAVVEGAVDGGHQGVQAGVLVLHGLQQGQVVGSVGQVGPHAGPQVGVFGAVMEVQVGREQLPAGQDSGAPGRVVQVGMAAAGDAGQVGQVAAEGVVEGHHHGQVQPAGRGAGHGMLLSVAALGHDGARGVTVVVWVVGPAAGCMLRQLDTLYE